MRLDEPEYEDERQEEEDEQQEQEDGEVCCSACLHACCTRRVPGSVLGAIMVKVAAWCSLVYTYRSGRMRSRPTKNLSSRKKSRRRSHGSRRRTRYHQNRSCDSWLIFDSQSLLRCQVKPVRRRPPPRSKRPSKKLVLNAQVSGPSPKASRGKKKAMAVRLSCCCHDDFVDEAALLN